MDMTTTIEPTETQMETAFEEVRSRSEVIGMEILSRLNEDEDTVLGSVFDAADIEAVQRTIAIVAIIAAAPGGDQETDRDLIRITLELRGLLGPIVAYQIAAREVAEG